MRRRSFFVPNLGFFLERGHAASPQWLRGRTGGPCSALQCGQTLLLLPLSCGGDSHRFVSQILGAKALQASGPPEPSAESGSETQRPRIGGSVFLLDLASAGCTPAGELGSASGTETQRQRKSWQHAAPCTAGAQEGATSARRKLRRDPSLQKTARLKHTVRGCSQAPRKKRSIMECKTHLTSTTHSRTVLREEIVQRVGFLGRLWQH
jgi:hypothetical protein